MVIAVRTERGADGLEVVKEADTEDERARLRHEADMLARAAHPGVVEVASSSPSGLRLRHRGTSLSRLGALPPDHVAAMVRSVAEVVDALHRQGVVHGRIDSDHVVVGDRGRPRLCGFAGAGDASDEGRAGDVADLGRLLDRLLDASGDTLWSHLYRGVRQNRRRRRALAGFRAAARAAQRDDPGQRPTARQFATAVHDALPDVALPSTSPEDPGRAFVSIPADIDPTADIAWTDDDLSYLTADDDEGGDPFVKLAELSGSRAESQSLSESQVRSLSGEAERVVDPLQPIRIRPGPAAAEAPVPRTGGRSLVVIAIVVFLIGAVAGVGIARALEPFGSGDPAAAGAAVPTTEAAEPRTPPTHPAHCAVPPVPGPDVDGDSCPEPVTLDGRTATVGTVRVELGREGDLAVVADHDCDGVATPVLLRPGSGELFLFDEWSLDEPRQVDAAAVVPGAHSIEAGPEACPSVRVTDGSGAAHVVAGPGA